MTAAAVPLVRAAGTPYEVGYQHGAARGEALRAFIDDQLCRINLLAPAPVSVQSLGPALAAYGAAITASAPRLSEEIDGLADGACISRELAVLLQVRREIIGYQRIPVRGDCTTYASLSAGPGEAGVVRGLTASPGEAGVVRGLAGSAGTGGPVLAQTVDLNGDLDDQIAVLDLSLHGSSRRALVLSFGGLLGYLGLNSDGLAIGLNLLLGGQWRPGLPPYLAIRHLLDHAGTVGEALAILRGLPLASSRSLTLCDKDRVACVEILGDEQRLVPMPEPGRTEPARTERAHTNHFLHPAFTGRDELNVFARNSSVQRLAACQAGLARFAAATAGTGVEEHFALLAAAPVCVADTGDIRRERTVAAVVLLPDRGELHVRPGNPAFSQTQVFRFAEAMSGAR